MSDAAGDPHAALDEVARILGDARSVLLTSHRRPDGDGTGSMVGLASLLRAAGKEAVLYSPDLIPRRYKWLPLLKGLVHRVPATARFDATIVVDCADLQLLGDALPPPEVRGVLISLDHHAAGRPFGDVTVCDPDAAAVSVLVARLARRLGWSIPADAATGLYVSLISDTGGFRHANTNVEALRLAAELVAAGAEPAVVSSALYERRPTDALRWLGESLARVEVSEDGRVAWLALPSGAVPETFIESEELVNYPRSIASVRVACLLRERGGTVKVSLRGKGDVDVNRIAARFGGGGHPNAAGCTVPGALAAVTRDVLAAVHAAMRGEPAASIPTRP